MKIIIYILCFIGLNQQTIAQQVEKVQGGTFLLKNATLVTITQGTVKGDLLIENGIISALGPNIAANPGYQVLDCTDKFIYPGFIDANTRLGLGEVGSVSLTQDHNELGDFTPHLQAITAINPNSVNIPVTRVSGVTTVLSVPSGGGFPGTAALIDLVGYTPQQMDAGFRAVMMSFPSTGKRGHWDSRSDEEIKKQKEKTFKNLNTIWEKAENYSKIKKERKISGSSEFVYQPEMEALLPIVRGESKVFIEVNRKKDIDELLRWLKDKDLDVVLTGMADGWRVADTLAKLNIPVITGRVLRSPSRNSERFDTPYKNAGRMAAAGVLVAISTGETENVRNLLFNAGFAANYGMGTEEALKSITINPAKIMGVDDKYGSLEKGKVANLFVCDGDPFEPKTQLSALFIRGWNVPLESRHTLLNDEFLERSPGLE